MIDHCTAVILTGGESRRMGRDKASAPFRGKPLWRHVHDALAPLFGQVLFSVREPRTDLPAMQIRDAFAARGPIVGIVSALMAVESEWVFVAGCDMPFIQPDLVRLMAEKRGKHDAVLGKVAEYPQPLPAFYARSALPVMQARLRRDHRSLMRLIKEDFDAVILHEWQMRVVDSALESFRDFDSLESLSRRELCG